MANSLNLTAPKYVCPADWRTERLTLEGVVVLRTGTYISAQADLDIVVEAAVLAGTPLVYLDIAPMGFTDDTRMSNPNAYYPTPALIAEEISAAQAAALAASNAALAVNAWVPNHVYPTNSIVQAPDGSTIARISGGTSRPTFDATEEAAWVAVLAKTGTINEKALRGLGLVFFTPERYGAVGDGVTNDTAALQAAIDAAYSAGGGTVMLSKRYGWGGDLLHKGAVTVMGVSLSKVLAVNDDMDRGLVALNSTARYRYGQWGGGSVNDNPGPLRNVVIDGDNIGGTTELLRMECVDGILEGVHVINSAGDGVQVGGSQNSTIDKCLFGYNVGKTMSFINVGQGAGNIKINDTYFTNGRYLLHMDSDPANFWPHDIFFSGCLFENRLVANDVALIKAGNVQFERCVFTQSHSDGPPPLDAIVKIEQTTIPTVATVAVFDSCYFNGGGNADKPTSGVLVNSTGGAGNIVRFYGHQNVTGADAFIGVQGAVASWISVNGTIYRGSVPWFTTAPGGSLAGVYTETASPTRFAMPDDASLLNPLMFRRLSDTADRFRIDRDGVLRWLDGITNTVTKASALYDATNDRMALGGLWRVDNAWALRTLSTFVSTANTAVALSPARTAGPSATIAFTAGAGTANITLDTGLTDGQQFQILLFGLASTNTVTWPSNISFGAGVPQPVAGKAVIVNLVWYGSSWYEVKGNDYSSITTNRVATGQETYSRDFVDQLNTAALSGQLSLTYFTAYQTQTITQLRTATGNTAAAATPTLCRMGLYTVASNGDLTLVASTANNTALWAAASTIYTDTLSASYTLIAGQRYAMASLCVSAAAMPTLLAHTPSSILGAESPRLMGQVGSQTDLPSSVTSASVATTNRRVYGELLP